jgi:hypothetical protein
MQKLNQVIAVEKGIKGRIQGDIVNGVYHTLQKSDLFNGFVKGYRPDAEDGEKLPEERKQVQYKVEDLLRQVEIGMTELMDISATKDYANCKAKGDVVVDGTVLVEAVPATFLLFMEKTLTDFHTTLRALPTLDVSESWSLDPNQNLYKTDKVDTVKTKKILKPVVLYPATDKHPAQVEKVTEDVRVGVWSNIRISGAIPVPRKEALVEKCEKLIKAVKYARESANEETAESVRIGNKFFSYLLGS